MDLYAILGIKRKASKADIKKAFKKKAKESHPDVNPESEEFVQINIAYSILSDPVKKIAYDKYGQAEDNSEEQARQLVLKIIEEMIQNKPDRPMQYIRRKIDAMRRNIKEAIKQNKNEIVRIRIFTDRMLKIDPFVLDHVNIRIETLQDIIKGITYELTIVEKAFKIFKTYRFKEEDVEYTTFDLPMVSTTYTL